MEEKPGRFNPDETMQELDRFIEEGNKSIRKYKTVDSLLSLAIVLIFGLFIWLFYSNISSDFSKEKIRASLQQRIPEIQSALTPHLQTMITKLAPVYLEESRKKFQEGLPEMLGEFKKEFSSFEDTLAESLTKELDKAAEDSLMRQQAKLQSLFPDLTAQQINHALNGAQKNWNNDFTEISRSTVAVFEPKWSETRQTLVKFANPALPDNDNELLKLFIHNALLLLDKEIMEGKDL